ncbi:5-oxoprolinase subunit PxpB [Staphylococcus saprophyticus]|uniref:5-oxoprolinase subunit PxpB n=1 Tax=Staphylococcus saprophyticus TaxID=29385 RepID=UPI0019D1A403|nr:5-oxoprolinase subunit PxpB [Staphylococcus saprophyticus]MBN6203676.1 5-oxoprolinase subunit PxpB [Staphylococcus saprophyticus]
MEYKIINEQTIMIYFDEQIDPDTFKEVQRIEQYIKDQSNKAILEIIPSYRAIMLIIDITQSDATEIINSLDLGNVDVDAGLTSNSQSKILHIPVYYGGDRGPDIETVAKHNQLTSEEVIKLHIENTYLIYMLGFMPGFPFLGGLNKQLHTPRREEPRTSIPAGSVGIANNQTGLYPKSSPGGWQIIGQTPIQVFDINRDPMCLYNSGDYIKFYAINEQTLNQIEEEQKSNQFDIEKWVTVSNEY